MTNEKNPHMKKRNTTGTMNHMVHSISKGTPKEGREQEQDLWREQVPEKEHE